MLNRLTKKNNKWTAVILPIYVKQTDKEKSNKWIAKVFPTHVKQTDDEKQQMLAEVLPSHVKKTDKKTTRHESLAMMSRGDVFYFCGYTQEPALATPKTSKELSEDLEPVQVNRLGK